MNHPTVTVTESNNCTALILTGPPSGGKSVIRDILVDYGVDVFDMEPYYESGELTDDTWRGGIKEAIVQAATEEPRVLVVEGVCNDKELDWIRSVVNDSLVVKVTASDLDMLLQRHVDNVAGRGNDQVVQDDAIVEAQSEFVSRYYAERPYPTHDVMIINDDDTAVVELVERMANLVSAISAVDRSDLVGPTDGV